MILYITAFNKFYYNVPYDKKKFDRDLKGRFDGLKFEPTTDQLEDLSKYKWIQTYTSHNGQMILTSHRLNKHDVMDNLNYEYARVFGEVQTTLF